MKSVGIICEYNPPHTGHRYQLDLLKSQGYEYIVCLMSGNFTQRGEIAVADKYTRAKCALSEGADIVIELPFPFCCMSAEQFADSGVRILSSLKVENLSFGHECKDINYLFKLADLMSSEKLKQTYEKNKKIGNADSFFELCREHFGNEFVPKSNDILAASYIKSIKKQGSEMQIYPIKRNGIDYCSDDLQNGVCPSALALRKLIYAKKSFSDLNEPLVSDKALSVLSESERQELSPVFYDNLDRQILSFFKLMSPDEISKRAIRLSRGGDCVAEDGCGIVNRLCSCASSSNSYTEFIESAKSSRFTNSRIMRVILFSLCGVSNVMPHSLPEYTTLLAANKRGCEYLSKIRKSSEIKLITKPADAPSDSVQYRISKNADALYTQAMPSPKDSGFFLRQTPYILS